MPSRRWRGSDRAGGDQTGQLTNGALGVNCNSESGQHGHPRTVVVVVLLAAFAMVRYNKRGPRDWTYPEDETARVSLGISVPYTTASR